MVVVYWCNNIGWVQKAYWKRSCVGEKVPACEGTWTNCRWSYTDLARSPWEIWDPPQAQVHWWSLGCCCAVVTSVHQVFVSSCFQHSFLDKFAAFTQPCFFSWMNSDRFLPDKAIDLIDEAGSRVRLRHAQVYYQKIVFYIFLSLFRVELCVCLGPWGS